MRIKQVSVEGLFGIFNHVIPLNMDDRITIVHGPNGFGKTAMLKMLNGLFNSQYSVFRNIPFTKFIVLFDDFNKIEVIKAIDASTKSKQQRELIKIELERKDSSKETHLLKEIGKSSDADWYINDLLRANNIQDLVPGLERIGSRNWIYQPTGEPFISIEEILERFEDILPTKIQQLIRRSKEPEWLAKIKNSVHIRLIESQRLLNVNIDIPNRSSRTYTSSQYSMLPTVSAYSEELATLIQIKLAEYATTSQSLDRTFPVRVLQQGSAHELTDKQLLNRLEELEKTRSRLIEVGLLDKGENANFQIHPQDVDEKTKNVLSVYVDDVEKKLSVFNEIASKIELLREIINNKFAYSYKQMDFSKERGFIFKTLNTSSLNPETLSPTDLSSGEQHELVLLYELLFKVQPSSLVLIDEPELSLHVGWQTQFLKDLQEITKLADLDILMATHSPDIIQDRWDLTVELKGSDK
ncbi:AAA family ATPase [Chamaesiphon sp. VAR_48_metabat_135_sub]|uniref:AAA family ATPase n=1 Tax=Chamaesiphon sp. VAR_48_metabat_135_sub TaxID=2964699 RepID=UPI00286CE4AC|nr:AAA family ATPase [Chamaesiphon sp. VAR_48_metabat_135_sub]